MKKLARKILPTSTLLRLKWLIASQKYVTGLNAWALNTKYDIELSYLVNNVLSSNSNAIDIGASEGEMSKMFLEKIDSGMVYSFEPIPRSYSILENKLSRYKNSRTFNLALSDLSGEVSFNIVDGNRGLSGFNITEKALSQLDADIKQVMVTTQRLDDIIPKDQRIDFIKIDVEGAEYAVLKGAENLIKRDKPIIFFEFESHAKAFGTNPDQIFDFFQNVGMNVYNTSYYILGKDPYSKFELEQVYKKEYETYFIAAKENLTV